MTQEQKRIAIAEACGWEPVTKQEVIEWAGAAALSRMYPNECQWWKDAHRYSFVCLDNLPDYWRDLNAMHEAEKTLEDPDLYERHLSSECEGSEYLFHATAAQRAEAFGRTLGLWE